MYPPVSMYVSPTGALKLDDGGTGNVVWLLDLKEMLSRQVY